ncbi:MAG: ISAs1 family transposase [Betaproteobacteria bacterium]|nr:ISAs1 family transposase [Betaproteobacteria bacterium]
MEAGKKIGQAEIWVGIHGPRQAGKAEYDLVEMLVVAVAAVLAGTDTFVEIEARATEKLDWLQQYLRLEHGTASHDTFGRLFAAISADEFAAAFRRWVGQVLPAPGADEVAATDGKTGRQSGKVGGTPSPLVSAFAAGAGLFKLAFKLSLIMS